MAIIPIELIPSTIRNGRIYFSTDYLSLFPADAVANDRTTESRAAGTVLIEADGIEYPTDIRISSSTRLSPRSGFGRWLKSKQAQAGDTARLVQLGARHFRLEYLGAAV